MNEPPLTFQPLMIWKENGNGRFLLQCNQMDEQIGFAIDPEKENTHCHQIDIRHPK